MVRRAANSFHPHKAHSQDQPQSTSPLPPNPYKTLVSVDSHQIPAMCAHFRAHTDSTLRPQDSSANSDPAALPVGKKNQGLCIFLHCRPLGPLLGTLPQDALPWRASEPALGACRKNTLHNLQHLPVSRCQKQKAARPPPASRPQVTPGHPRLPQDVSRTPARPLGGPGTGWPQAATYQATHPALNRLLAEQEPRMLDSHGTEGAGSVIARTEKARSAPSTQAQ